ncbi:MAG: TetR/AcrR family transcriptional regulator [Deferribacterales bacterium]
MSKSLENHLRKQSQIADAAKKLFLENGYAGTGMDTVAKEAGVTKQTVYRYFPSKEELFQHIIKSMSEKQAAYTFGRRGVLEELIRYGEDLILYHMQPQRLEFWRLMVAEGGRSGNIGKMFREINQTARKTPLINYLRDNLNMSEPEKLADMFCSLLLYTRPQILMGSADVPDAEAVRDHAQLSAEIFVNGLLSL